MKLPPMLILFLTCTTVLPVGAVPAQSTAAADVAFQKGDFTAAQSAYARAAQKDPTDFQAMIRLGYLALLGNHLREARHRLEAARQLQPDSRVPKALLAETYTRQDNFTQAAPLLRAIGAAPEADQFASFAGQSPYEITRPGQTTTLKFVAEDPLPIVQVRVNGSAPANFLIDTGASQLTLDTDWAKALGVQLFGSSTGTFAGGKQAPFRQGRVASVTLGDLQVNNVPVVVMPVRPVSSMFGGLQIDGIIGTVLLYHFLATLDYPQGRLVLQPRADAAKAQQAALARGAVSVPFWMAGDHFMVAHGTINGGASRLFLVDTGLAGGGFSGSEATLTEEGIKLDRSQAGEGVGGGGPVQIIPFDVDTLTLGRASQRHVHGLFAGPLPFEDALGFHMSGLISHGFFRAYAVTLDFTNMEYYLRLGGH